MTESALQVMPASVNCEALLTFLSLIETRPSLPHHNPSNFLLSILQDTAGSRLYAQHGRAAPRGRKAAVATGARIINEIQV